MSAAAQFDPDQFMAGRQGPPAFDPDQFMAQRAQNPEHPGYWHELWQQSGIPGLVEGLEKNPKGTVATALGSLLSIVRPGLTPVPDSHGHVSVSMPSQGEQAMEIAERGPAAIGAAATLGAVQAAAPKVIPALADTAAGTAVTGAVKGAVRAIPRAAETSVLKYTGLPQLTRGAIKGAKEALAERAAQAAEVPPEATPAPTTQPTPEPAPAEDTELLDAISAQQANGKRFSKLGAAEQATVRELAKRFNSEATPEPAAPVSRPPATPIDIGTRLPGKTIADLAREELTPAQPATPQPVQPPPEVTAGLNSGVSQGSFLRNMDLDNIARAIRVELNKGTITKAQARQIIGSEAGVQNLREQLGIPKGRFNQDMIPYLRDKVFR